MPTNSWHEEPRLWPKGASPATALEYAMKAIASLRQQLAERDGKIAELTATVAEHESEQWCFNEAHRQNAIDAARFAALRATLEVLLRQLDDGGPPWVTTEVIREIAKVAEGQTES